MSGECRLASLEVRVSGRTDLRCVLNQAEVSALPREYPQEKRGHCPELTIETEH